MSDPGAHPSVAQVPRPPHFVRCGWFWGWAAIGAAGALGLVSLGPVALAPAVIAGAAMVRNRNGRQSLFGLLAGGGLVSLLVAYVQRHGPGTTCWHTATAGGCDQHLSPIPWLIAGVLLTLCAIAGQARRRA